MTEAQLKAERERAERFVRQAIPQMYSILEDEAIDEARQASLKEVALIEEGIFDFKRHVKKKIKKDPDIENLRKRVEEYMSEIKFIVSYKTNNKR